MDIHLGILCVSCFNVNYELRYECFRLRMRNVRCPQRTPHTTRLSGGRCGIKLKCDFNGFVSRCVSALKERIL